MTLLLDEDEYGQLLEVENGVEKNFDIVDGRGCEKEVDRVECAVVTCNFDGSEGRGGACTFFPATFFGGGGRVGLCRLHQNKKIEEEKESWRKRKEAELQESLGRGAWLVSSGGEVWESGRSRLQRHGVLFMEKDADEEKGNTIEEGAITIANDNDNANDNANVGQNGQDHGLDHGQDHGQHPQEEVVKKRPKSNTNMNEISAIDTHSIEIKKTLRVSGSTIHGWGLFATEKYSKGEIVAEYIGEYVRNKTADAREEVYKARRIQDYLFRVTDEHILDATIKGGYARYINHCCFPNCWAKTIDGGKDEPEWKKRVLIYALTDISIGTELTYDYQFAVESDWKERLPCFCGHNQCRQFLNWDLPEKLKN